MEAEINLSFLYPQYGKHHKNESRKRSQLGMKPFPMHALQVNNNMAFHRLTNTHTVPTCKHTYAHAYTHSMTNTDADTDAQSTFKNKHRQSAT